MIPSEEEKVFWIFDLVSKQKADGLKRLLATVHIVTEK
jgi:hypothetical protein